MTEAFTESGKLLWLDMGQWPVYFGVTSSEVAFNGAMKRMRVEESVSFLANEHSNATTHEFIKDGKTTYIICMQPPSRKVSKEAYAALLAHECIHVIQYMQNHLANGHRLGFEAEAYLMQYLLQESLQFLWQTGNYRSIKPNDKDKTGSSDPVDLTQE